MVASPSLPRRVRRAITSRLPFVTMASEVHDVLYLHWVVLTDRVRPLVPPGVRLLERQGKTILTGLSYRHGHFGPAFLGPARQLLPSPQQSNWRLYVEPGSLPDAPDRLVLFIRNLFDSALYTVATSWMSDVLLSELATTFVLRSHERTRLNLAGREGMIAEVEAHRGSDRQLPPDFEPFFGGWSEAVDALLLQDAAIARTADGLLALSSIDLPIAIDTLEPLIVDDVQAGAWLASLGVASSPWCMRVPSVPFRVLSERLIASAPAGPL